MSRGRTGEDVEHGEPGEGAGGDGEEEGEEVHERKHGPGEHDEDQEAPALLRSRNEAFLAEDEERHQDEERRQQEVEQIAYHVG